MCVCVCECVCVVCMCACMHVGGWVGGGWVELHVTHPLAHQKVRRDRKEASVSGQGAYTHTHTHVHSQTYACTHTCTSQ